MSNSPFRVRDLIFAYENQKLTQEDPTENGRDESPEPLRHRTKSIGNLFSFANIFRKNKTEMTNIVDIEKELIKLDAHLHYYQDYTKETHVAFQEQIFNVLTSIVIIDSRGDENISQKKKELLGEVQRLVSVLNKKLPYGTNKQPQNSVKHESSKPPSIKTHQQEKVYEVLPVKKAESFVAVHTNSDSTPLQEIEHLEDRSTDQTKPTKDEKLNRNFPDSPVKYIPYSQVANSPAVLNDIEPGLIPSVSKLKQRFQSASTTRLSAEAPETGTTTRVTSGVSRSQSVRVYSRSNYGLKSTKTETSWRSGNNVDEEAVKKIEDPNELGGKSEVKYEEVTEEGVERSVDDGVRLSQSEESASGLVSVYKLRNLFEDRSKEISQGNYMNYAGLLRSTSKSTSDLVENGTSEQEPFEETERMWVKAGPTKDLSDLQDGNKGLVYQSNDEEGQVVSRTQERSNNQVEADSSTPQLLFSCPTGLPENMITYQPATYSSVTQQPNSLQDTHTVVSSPTKSVQNTKTVEVVEEPVSYAVISSNGDEENVVKSAILTNGENPVKITNGNRDTKNDDATEEYFNNAEVSENVDDEFNKLVDASDIPATS